jgi:hypothetical protein
MLNLNANTATAAIVASTATLPVGNVVLPPVAATTAAPVANVPSNAGKYGANHKAVATRTVTYALTALGTATAAANGAGKGGKVTCMGLVAVAAARLAAKGVPLTGANLVAAMRALPAVKAAWANTRAAAQYANGVPTKAWCSGYIAGAARSPASLLAVVTA